MDRFELRCLWHNRAIQVLLLAVLSLLVYVVFFDWHYSILQWSNAPLQNYASMSYDDNRAAVSYLVGFALLFLFYGITCWLVSGRQSRAVWGVVLAGASSFSIALLLIYPVGAADLFDNIMRGRILSIHGGNPFLQVAADYPGDPFYPYVAWKYRTSAYGPIWEIIAAGMARMGGDEVILNVIALKAPVVLAYGGTVALIGQILRARAPERALSGVVFFAWNPLVVYVFAGNGHNDAIMVFFMVLGFYWLTHERFTLAAVAQTAGALTKFIPAFLIPVVFVVAMIKLERWSDRFWYMLRTVSVCGLLSVALFGPFWHSGDVLGVKYRSESYTTSLPAIIKKVVDEQFKMANIDTVLSRASLFLLALWVVWQLYNLWRRPRPDGPVRSSTSILLFYLLVVCLWLQAWYVSWAVALAALLPSGFLRRGVVLVSLAALVKMPLLDFYLVRFTTSPTIAWPELPLSVGVMILPWLYFLVPLLMKMVAGLISLPVFR